MLDVVIRQDGEAIAMLGLDAKTFSTGNKGFFATGKVAVAGVRHQVTLNMAQIHAKPNGKNAKK